MKYKKSGFSLVELLLVLSVIGIIIVFGLQIIQPKINDYAGPYLTAYTALQKGIYNVMADLGCPNEDSEDEECKEIVRPFPKASRNKPEGSSNLVYGSVELCERLKEYVNFVDDESAGSCGEHSDDPKARREINIHANNINSATLKFTATNSMRYYISDEYTYTFPEKTVAFEDGTRLTVEEEDRKYFIVYVDINGEQGPNRVFFDESNKVMPDIVPFAVTERGEVIPIGYPIYDKIYLTTKIKLPAVQMEDKSIHDNEYSKTYTFNEAKGGAWGDDESSDIALTMKINERLIEDKNIALGVVAKSSENDDDSKVPCFETDRPNDDDIIKCQMMDITDTEKFKTKALLVSEGNEEYNCKEGTFNCSVVIDSAVTRRY